MSRAWKVCSCIGCAAHPGSCPAIVATGNCPTCRSAADRARGTRHERGYGTEHDRIRARLLRRFIPGAPCPKCGLPMLRGQALDAGHSEDLRVNPNAKADQLEHASCNRGWRKGELDQAEGTRSEDHQRGA